MKYRIKVEIDGNGLTTYTPQRKGWILWKNYTRPTPDDWDEIICFRTESEVLNYLDTAKYLNAKNMVRYKYYRDYS